MELHPAPSSHCVLHGQFVDLRFAQPHCFFPDFSSLMTLINHPVKATEGEELAFPTDQGEPTKDHACLLAAPEMVRSKRDEGALGRGPVRETKARPLR